MNWTTEKPTQPGGYWIRGWNIGSEHESALIEVREIDGELRCNLHAVNTHTDDDDFDMWIEDCSPDFEYCGPLPSPPNT